MNNITCPCCSGKPFSKCCEPYVSGKKKPVTVKQTMRARYTAYALGGYGDYLFHTWHPQYRGGLTAKSLAQKTQNWTRLEVFEAKQVGDRAAIEFKAYYTNDKGVTQCHHEFSQFLRHKGRWFYTDGKVRMEEVPSTAAQAGGSGNAFLPGGV
jgi:SEC-C motif-containing protein